MAHIDHDFLTHGPKGYIICFNFLQFPGLWKIGILILISLLSINKNMKNIDQSNVTTI